MRKTLHALMAVAVLSAFGCSAEKDFCKKLKEWDPEGQDDCETDAVPEVKERCENPEEVFSCVAKAADEKSGGECMKVCKKKEKKE